MPQSAHNPAPDARRRSHHSRRRSPVSVAPPPATRRIILAAAVNVRDVGGCCTRQGHRVRYGHVFRSDALNKLTCADVAALAGLDLRTVVDFRIPFEIDHSGADRLPDGVAWIVRSISQLDLYRTMISTIHCADHEAQQATLADGKAEKMMHAVYRGFVSDPDNRAAFSATLHDLANCNDPRPLLFHCTSGKDRTGWMTYILLRALGVEHRDAESEYLLSNDFCRAASAATRTRLKAAGLIRNPDLLIPLQEVRSDYLAAALDQARHEYGGVIGYIRDGLALRAPARARLRARLLNDDP